MIKKDKSKKIKLEKYHSEEQIEISRFIRILIIVIILILGIYFFTRIFVTKDLLNNKDNEQNITQGTVNYTITMIGALLQKPEDEYYVMIYDTENLRSIYYSGLMTNYAKNENALKVYFADLNKALNKKFYNPENINLKVSKISDLRVGDLTLLKIKDGKISEAYNDENQIANLLKYNSDEKDA